MMMIKDLLKAIPGMVSSLLGGTPADPKWVTKEDAARMLVEIGKEAGSRITYLEIEEMNLKSDIAALRGILEVSKGAVQSYLDMVNVMSRVGAVPIPSILDIAKHNCPIIISQIEEILQKTTEKEYGDGR